MNLKIKRLHPGATLPRYATEGAACFDLHALLEQDIGSEPDKPHPLIIKPGCAGQLRTGLAFEIPPGWVMEVFSRSGHGFKHGVRLVNSVGVIDADYRGEVQVALHNDGRGRFLVRHGDRIAQARLVPAPQVQMVEVEELSETARGAGGFGSTGA